jgi:hypothetical protein
LKLFCKLFALWILAASCLAGTASSAEQFTAESASVSSSAVNSSFSQTASSSGFSPEGHLFHKLLADPREVQLLMSYYRMSGLNMGDVALGHRWGIERWEDRYGTQYQLDIEGMAYSRFQVGLGINYLETIDYIANLPLEIRHGPYSGEVMLFHESSHLGDGYIRQTGNLGSNYSVNGFRTVFSRNFAKVLRIYGGGAYLIDVVPASLGRGVLQGGFELKSRDFNALKIKRPLFAYLAEDLQSHQDVAWNVNSNTVAGIGIRARKSGRVIRIQLGYFAGHSPFGQFYLEREHYANLALAFDL